MKFRLVYPRWRKLTRQTEFHLPPHGPVVFAATVPGDVDLEFVDENVEPLDLDSAVDLVGISMMLTGQVKRGWNIADEYRKRGIPVLFGGIAAMLHAEETMHRGDSVFLGEAEGRMERVFQDLREGRLRRVYDYLNDHPPIEGVGTARREILKRDLYNYHGVQMVDLVHASRGCRFNCYPCSVRYLGGRKFRPRPYDRVVRELASIDNKRLYVVDNSLAQDREWVKGLFREMIPLKKRWCSHPIEESDEVLDLAVQAGAWYVYQAVFDTSDYIRNRIKRYHDHGIAVEAAVLLGLDEHTEEGIKRLIDFLLEVKVEVAEFSILTPFPHTRAYEELLRENRITSFDWDEYTADKVVFRPKHMSPEKLQMLYDYAWDTFYRDEPQRYKMFKLFKRLLEKDRDLSIVTARRRDLVLQKFGKRIEG